MSMTKHDHRNLATSERAAEYAHQMRAKGFHVKGVEIAGRKITVLLEDAVANGPSDVNLDLVDMSK